jgi:hypothetical protein
MVGLVFITNVYFGRFLPFATGIDRKMAVAGHLPPIVCLPSEELHN